jgi:hypothetical protein
MSNEVFLIQSEFLGRGDNQLGTMLMANFMRILGDTEERPSKVIFWNS